MTGNGNFGPMMPGMDFLQNLMKSAGSAMPGMTPWITPTLDPEELDKRIADLRTVQFWLEQNARLIGTTIQTLEVQRMTLSTLKNLNLSVGDLAEAFRLKEPAGADGSPAPAKTSSERPSGSAAAAPAAAKPAGGEAGAGVVDPVQWWAALTQQFTEVAAQAMRDGAAAASGATAAAAQAATAPAAADRTVDGCAKRRATGGRSTKSGDAGSASAPGKTTRRAAPRSR